MAVSTMPIDALLELPCVGRATDSVSCDDDATGLAPAILFRAIGEVPDREILAGVGTAAEAIMTVEAPAAIASAMAASRSPRAARASVVSSSRPASRGTSTFLH